MLENPTPLKLTNKISSHKDFEISIVLLHAPTFNIVKIRIHKLILIH